MLRKFLLWLSRVLDSGGTRYRLHWNIPGLAYGDPYISDTGNDTFSLKKGEYMVTEMNKEYGQGTHWLEKV